MKTQQLNTAHCGAVAMIGLLSVAAPVLAEGHQDFGGGAHGVNRVIRTAGDPFDANSSTGYVGARGEVNMNFSMPTDADGMITQQTNPYDNKPTAYLGAQGPNASGGGAGEVDAGYQFETGVHEFTRPDGSTGYPLPGWTPFVSQGDVFLNIRVYDPVVADGVPWRGSGSWTGGSGSIRTNMEFAVTLQGDPANLSSSAGGLRFTADGLGTVYWNQTPYGPDPNNDPRIPNSTHPVAPWRAQTVFNISSPNRINVKRVVAMTRRGAGADLLDGSSMSATFAGCEVRLPDQSWVDWASATVRHTTRELRNTANQVTGQVSGTGYDAPGNGTANNGAWDKRVRLNGTTYTTPTSATIVEFPSLTVIQGGTTLTGANANIVGRENSQASQEARQGTVSRYNTETVSINLGTATLPRGQAVQLP